MSNFLISPGVITREVDNSQYAATQPGLGNIAALVGYAEKGSFDPTLVTGVQDFIQKYGKTLPNVPYLAQAAYKYFEENDTLLVVRAGNNQDPDAYPNAAQYSNIKVRLNPTVSPATPGYQTFSTIENVAPGTFSNGTTYSFKVLSDFRAFKTPKIVETWNGQLAETASSMGTSPVTNVSNAVLKMAFDTTGASSFEANYKRLNSNGETAEYYGTGTNSGVMFGDTVTATLYKYRSNSIYEDVDTDFITINAVHAANVIGTQELTNGYDFSTNNGEFKVTIGTNQFVITLDANTSDIDSLVAEINTKLASADDGLGGTVDLTSQLQAVKIEKTTTESYIMLKKVGGSSLGFSLQDGTTAPTNALTVFGWEAKEYLDATGLVGTWHAETVITTTETFDGILGYNLTRTQSNVMSFESYINISVTAPSAGEWELSDIVSQISSQLAVAYDGTHTDDGLAYSSTEARGTATLFDNKIKIISSGDASDTFNSIVRIEQPDSGNSLLTLLDGVDQPVDGTPESSIGEAIYTIQAAEKGSYGQDIIFRTETKVVNYGTQQFTYNNIYILIDGYEVKNYQKVNWTDSSDPNFFLTRMKDDPYLTIEIEDEDDDTEYAQMPDGDWKLGQGELPNGVNITDAEIISYNVGTNGWTEVNGIITSMSSDYKKALEKIYNPEVYEFNLVAAPGTADPIVQNAIQDLCESRKDCFGIIDAAPFGLGIGIKEGVNDVTDVTSAVSTINSSYVGAFWPWLQDYDSDNEQYIWLPPSIYALKSMVYTDNISDPWYAPAGTTRGKVSALDVEYSPSKTDRDLLYGDTNIVNPIVYLVGEGITIWGQKTGQRTKSATDRINVRRLLIYAEKLIAKMARGFLFEPNDSANWAAFSRQANAILEPIRQKRGLYQYTVVCDETTNTADLIDQNIMAGKIFVQPTKTMEFIQVDFTVDSTGSVSVKE